MCDGFFPDITFLDACPRLAVEQLPQLPRALLVHREHMTRTLGQHYGGPVRLHVLTEQRDANQYGRKIQLTAGPQQGVVELGVVRLDFSFVSEQVRGEVLARQAPLGDILTRHNVLRRISPRWYFRFPQETPIAQALSGGRTGYGRVATIYCDEEPAIDLLEVVAEA